MSQGNVNVVRGLYQAFATGDIPVIIAALDPQVECWEAENFIYTDNNPYVGPDAVLCGVFMRIGNDGTTSRFHLTQFWMQEMYQSGMAITAEPSSKRVSASEHSLLTSSPCARGRS